MRKVVDLSIPYLLLFVQLGIGIGLGYCFVKALKYMIAFAMLSFLAAMVLSIQLPDFTKKLFALAKEFLFSLLTLLVGPLAVGFVIGAVIALVRG